MDLNIMYIFTKLMLKGLASSEQYSLDVHPRRNTTLQQVKL